MINLTTPLNKKDIKALKAGDRVNISGVIYTARDAAHKRIMEAIEKGLELPFDLEGQLIYYVGPCPKRPGEVIGSCGPTTSGRMDKYAPALHELGLMGTLGKGYRSESVRKSIEDNGCVYFLATGGAGALIAKKVLSAEVIAYEELGAEAIWKLEVRDFPVVVGIDSSGCDIYEK